MISVIDISRIPAIVKTKWGKDYHKEVHFCGLEPVDSDLSLESIPKNSIQFASTGGDAVFSLVTNYKNLTGDQPIVMTVPVVGQNIVVSENLEEFLGIGYYNGWSALEQLVYDFDKTLDYYSITDSSLSKEEKNFIILIRNEFTVKPSPLTKDRLDQLRMKYFDSLEF
jgi:hypothetical protein